MRASRFAPPAPESDQPAPRYEIRFGVAAAGTASAEIWQVPSPATPQLKKAKRIGGLKGRNLGLVEHRLLRRLQQEKIDGAALSSLGGAAAISEELALRLSLLFKTLAPMSNRERMLACADGIDNIGRQEAAYWLGMAMHRRNPRRILWALRVVLTEPEKRRKD